MQSRKKVPIRSATDFWVCLIILNMHVHMHAWLRIRQQTVLDTTKLQVQQPPVAPRVWKTRENHRGDSEGRMILLPLGFGDARHNDDRSRELNGLMEAFTASRVSFMSAHSGRKSQSWPNKRRENFSDFRDCENASPPDSSATARRVFSLYFGMQSQKMGIDIESLI